MTTRPSFPKNISTVFEEKPIGISTNRINVFNDTIAEEIFSTNGWYLIPPASTARIIKIIRLPVLIHDNDLSVADLTTFGSYTERRLDKSTTWSIDTGIKITRVVDPGGPANIDVQTRTIQLFGEIKTYTIERER